MTITLVVIINKRCDCLKSFMFEDVLWLTCDKHCVIEAKEKTKR